MSKKSKKRVSILKSKPIILAIAVVAAFGVIIGVKSFASSPVPTIPSYCLSRVNKQSDKDPNTCVKYAQKALNFLCKQPDLTVNGYWVKASGWKTDTTGRVRGYQYSIPTTPDAIIGGTTWRSLNNRLKAASSAWYRYYMYHDAYDCNEYSYKH